MLPDRVSNSEPLTYESGARPIALRGPAKKISPQTNRISENCLEEFSFRYSRTSMAQTLMARLPRLFRTHS